MTRLDGVPFLAIRPREHNGGWILESPAKDTCYNVSHIELMALSFCDGFRTLAEIIEELHRSSHPKLERIMSDSCSLLRALSDDGIIWWRQNRMTRRLMQPPSSVIWELTDRCNLSCRHCVTEAGRREFNEMPIDECINLIRELAAFGVPRLVLSGGEPLIRSDFFEIAHECIERKFKTQVATNATLVTKEVAQALANFNIDVQVSLNGATPKVHEYINRGLGSFSKTMKGIQSLVRAGVHVTIATVVMNPNLHEIIPILNLAEKSGAHEFRLLPFLPAGRGAVSKDLQVHPLDIRNLVIKLHGLRKKTRIQIAPMEFECTLEKPSQVEPDQQAPVGCDGARHYCTITSSGDVLPCAFFRGVSAENIKDLGFMRIWRNSRFLSYFRSLTVTDIQGKCQLCEWLYDCRGGCLAVNYLDGSLFQSNARCWQKYMVKEE